MSYSYQKEKANLFTESGAATLLAVRDEAKLLIELAGACTAEKAMKKATGSSWTMLAALDYMVERGELRRVTVQGETWGQHQVFVIGRH